MLRRWDDSQKYLSDNPHLVCEETANYLVIWCIDLEVEEVREKTRGCRGGTDRNQSLLLLWVVSSSSLHRAFPPQVDLLFFLLEIRESGN